MTIRSSPRGLSSQLTRRTFLAAGSSMVAGLCLPGTFGAVTRMPRFENEPFSLGVASGDPTPDGIVLWTRLAPDPTHGGGMPPDPVEVRWQIAEDEGMSRVVGSGTAIADPAMAHSVHVEVEGLRPGRWYWYQFKAGDATSPKGRTRTLPPPGSVPENFRFAFASCQHYETGYYTAYQHMVRDDLDLVVHLGDYIYEGAGQNNRLRKHVGPELRTLDQYRNRYAQYKSDPALMAAHAAFPWIVTWDDHEVANNYAADILGNGRKPQGFLRRRAAAYQAYYEHMPLRRRSLPDGPDMLLYRKISVGQLASFFVLDTRQYRTDQPCGDGNKPPCPEALDPNATIMGNQQREWLFDGLAHSPSRWNILAQQVMMARVDRSPGEPVTYSMDQWPGYEAERRRVLKFFHDRKISNPVVLAGDIHSNWANELIADFDQLGSASVAAEFVGTSISSSGNGTAHPGHLEELLSENPFVKFHNAERGYVRCRLSPAQWQTDYCTVPYVTRPDAPLNVRAKFILESGSPRLQSA